ncbi:hypothetical protein GCM10009765_66500 [Fodinicola feengrottensis]|uniref:Uncharacterized protein n=2 Tax=Fodinicola feengrottensis TaxID=435914 RepID=A0ABN2ILY4_9ACTN
MPFLVDATQLRYAISVITPHLSPDQDDLPILTHALVQFTGTDMWLYATDRFTMGAYHLQPARDSQPTGAPYQLTLSHLDLRLIRRLAADPDVHQLTLDAVHPDTAPDAGRGTEWILEVNAGRYRSPINYARPATYPNFRAIMEKSAARTTAVGTLLDAYVSPEYLARFDKLTGPVKLRAAGSHSNDSSRSMPLIVGAGRFVGAIAVISRERVPDQVAFTLPPINQPVAAPNAGLGGGSC